jgi:biopolymer transport protein ExbD
MDTGAPRGKAKSDINVTPLIDIVLVLLIVFIVMVPGLTKALAVAVPRVVRTQAPPPPDPRHPPLVVTLDARGALRMQDSPIGLDKLAGALVPVVQQQPMGQRRVFLKVDGDQPWQRVVDVLDQIRVASDLVRKETAHGSGGGDGGDIKVAISQLAAPAA